MSNGLRQHLKDHYTGESLSHDALEKIRGLVEAVEPMSLVKAGSVKRIRLFATVCGVAAIVAIAAIPFAYQAGKQTGQGEADRMARPAAHGSGEAASAHDAPQLVAVRLHADWCNRCPQIVPVFERAQREYGMKPVLLVTLDLTDDVHRRQSERLAEAIGVRWVLDRGLHTGTIALVDREKKKILALLTDPSDWPSLASAIGENLAH